MKFFTSKLDYQILSAFLIGSFIGLIGLYIFDSSNSNAVVERPYDISSNSYNSAVKKAAPAVVNISTEQISKPLR